jgi:hypothetical protein
MNRPHRPAACTGWILIFFAACLCPGLGLAKSMPDWVDGGGSSQAYPSQRYLTGFGQAEGKEDALESAKQQAAADLARQISVQIESNVVDVTHESNGKYQNDLTSQIRATSDIRLDGIRFITHRKRKQVWALAILERLPAAVARRKQRDQSLALTKQCLDNASKEESAGRANQALSTYRSCRTPLDAALEHEAIASAIQRQNRIEDGAGTLLAQHSSLISARVRAIPHEDASSIRSAAEGLAAQFARAGVGRGQHLQVAPFLYQSRDISSPFGRELAIALESAVGRTPAEAADSKVESVVIRGSYHEDEGLFQLRATAKEPRSGRLLASAEIRLARKGIPKNIETRPANFETFAQNADKLAGGDLISGDLRVELRTNKGIRGLVFDEGEELSIYVRVNRPSWISLIYVLTNGEHVPIEQAWYIDNSMVNQLVEYPSSFEIVAPFGVEMIHAMAHTEKPLMLITRPTRIEGQDYQVIAEGADQVVRHRGIARKEKKQVAEQTVQLTTMRVEPL